DEACGPGVCMIARLAMQDRNVEHAEEMQSGDDDDDSGDLAEDIEILGDQLTSECRRGTEDDKDRGEAGHEGEGGQNHRRVDMRRRLILARKLVEGGAAEEAEIRWHERQHASRTEAQEARDQRSEIGDIHVRAFTNRNTAIGHSIACNRKAWSITLTSKEMRQAAAARARSAFLRMAAIL